MNNTKPEPRMNTDPGIELLLSVLVFIWVGFSFWIPDLFQGTGNGEGYRIEHKELFYTSEIPQE